MANLDEIMAKEMADGVPRGTKVDADSRAARPTFDGDETPVPVALWHRPYPDSGTGLTELLAVELHRWDQAERRPYVRLVKADDKLLAVGIGVSPRVGLSVVIRRTGHAVAFAFESTGEGTRPCGCGCGRGGVILMTPEDAAALVTYVAETGWRAEVGSLPITVATVQREAFAGLADAIVQAQSNLTAARDSLAQAQSVAGGRDLVH